MRGLRVLLPLLLLTTACAPKPPEGAALFVSIKRGQARSTCVRISLNVGGSVTDLGSKPFNTAGTVGLGIVQQDSEPEVTVSAVGGEGSACTATTPAERASKTLRFPGNGTDNHELTLEPVSGDGGTDAGVNTDAGADSDAGFDADAGTDAGRPDAGRVDGGTDAGPIDGDNDGSPLGVDCDDADPQRFPGNPERCFGGVDEDCNNQIDCAQSVCASRACGLGVDGGAMCVGTTCVELNCGNIQDDDLDTATDCADSNCADLPCAAGGTCTGPVCQQGVESSCEDGTDNDGDNQIDCLDPDCNTRPCNDGLSCRTGDTCVGTVCTASGMRMCTTPPNTACFGPTGTCQEADAGCSYSVLSGAGCDDGKRCTTNDRCADDGGCQGTQTQCLTPPACRQAGSCVEADGGCFYPPGADGTLCSDGDPCTLVDACQSGRCEPGLPPVCPPIDCQTVAPGCLGDGGCNYVNLPFGATCAGGRLCDGNGSCGARFPYTPSNFGEADIPADAGPAIVINCAITWNINAAGVIQPSGCNTTIPPSRLISQQGAPDLLLIHARALFIGDAGSLTITGDSFPVAIAATGSIIVSGSIDVSGSTANSGPGADSAACAGSLGTNGQATAAAPRGGASGGSFGAVGGNGGNGVGGTNLGGDAGVASGTAELVPLRGGCRGGTGGGVGGGVAGRAGGAIQLSAADQLRIRGRVTSVGIGGGGGGVTSAGSPTEGQGGGGGSGGAILLEARQVDIVGHVSANGGAGGEGRGSAGFNGAPGEDGRPTGTTRALGGSSVSWGGNGGAGGTRTTTTGGPGLNGEQGAGGGGGGGGTVGRIRVNAPQGCTGTAATMSPQASSATAACRY